MPDAPGEPPANLDTADRTFSQLVLDSVPANTAVLDANGVIVQTNEAWSRFTAANGGSLASCGVGTNYIAVCRAALRDGGEAAQHAENVLAALPQVLRNELAQLDVVYECSAPWERRWFLMRAVPLTAPLRGAVVSHIDITRLKLAEEALRESETRLRTVTEAAPVVLFALDASGRCTFLSGNSAATLGIDPARAIGERAVSLLGGDPDVPGHVASVLGGQPVSARLRLGESRRTIDLRLVPHAGPDGRQAGAMGVLIDVTERQQLEEALLQARKMESLGRLAGGIAHDFNNMLTAIRGFTELAQNEPGAGDDVRALLAEIDRAAARATTVTRQLLSFARRQVVEPAPVSFNDVLGTILPLLRRLVPEHIELVTEFAEDLWPARADRGQIEQVIVNLALNARDAMPGGGRLSFTTANVVLDEGEVRAAGLTGREVVRIRVADTGQGMTGEVRERLFEPFFTTKPSGLGTGLGLATCYGIVQQHGGRIDVHSAPGAGTEFRIDLPRAPGAVPDVPAPVPESGAPRGSEFLLVVEDDAPVRHFTVRALTALGYRVLEAENGARALELLENTDRPLDLVVTDVVMPGLDGFELVALIRESQPGLPAVLVTGYGERLLLPGGETDGRTSLLDKPFGITALARTVRALLDRVRG